MHPEQQAEQRRRLETIGRMAGIVVHDFNNLLMVMDGYARMVLEDPAISPATRDCILEILKASGRASELTRQLLQFSRHQPIDTERLQLHRLIEELRPMLERVLGETITLELDLRANEPNLEANRSQFEQVLLNLVVNARDAIEAQGRVTIRTTSTHEHCRLEVEDTGSGIPAELEGRIFEPFFTTKPTDKGTGLGLAMVAEAVEKWGARIEVASQPGQGTRMSILIPQAQPKLGGKVLVVEDEPAVRALILRALRQSGHQVWEAENTASALELLKSLDELDVLISDLEIPGGTGQDIAVRARERHPRLKTLLISGYAQSQPQPNQRFLQKPFSTKTLVLAVHDLLKLS
jgi:CheY-like chemotaxis protein